MPGSIDRLMFYDADRKAVEDYYKFSPITVSFPIPINKTNDFDEYLWRFSKKTNDEYNEYYTSEGSDFDDNEDNNDDTFYSRIHEESDEDEYNY
jgi:hypothetical protein